MSFVVTRLYPQNARLGWEKAGAYLIPPITRTRGLYQPEDVRDLVCDPESGWSLWLIAEGASILGAWTTEVKRFPRARVMYVEFGGGREMARWYPEAMKTMEEFARECGCDRFRCGGRPGWARFGMTPIGHVFERMLP